MMVRRFDVRPGAGPAECLYPHLWGALSRDGYPLPPDEWSTFALGAALVEEMASREARRAQALAAYALGQCR